jgi:hypothetical protein
MEVGALVVQGDIGNSPPPSQICPPLWHASGSEFQDTGTQRNGMHSCPVGAFVVGAHVNQNRFLCSTEFGGYSEGQERVDMGETQVQGMHACPEGMAMTGLHASKNWLACAPLEQALPRFVDLGTHRAQMHACPPGSPMSGIHVSKNLLLCGTTGGFDRGEFIDAGTQRNGMHSCPVGAFVVGVHVNLNYFLCSADLGGYAADQELVDEGETQFQGMHACPEGMAMTGLHAGKNWLACAPLQRALIRFVDLGTQRAQMHACPPGSPISGIHVNKNLLLCGTSGGFDSGEFIDHGT